MKRTKRRSAPDEELYFGDGRTAKEKRKDKQLCAQALRALSLALAESDDDVLSSAWLCDVEARGGRLRVLVQAARVQQVEALRHRLAGRAGHLRHELAQVIHRKRVPSLTFVVFGPPSPGGSPW